MKLELKKFDINRIQDDKVVVMIGKRHTGKSFLIQDLLYHHTDLPIGTVISGTESANGFYGNMVPRILIHDEYKAGIIENVVARQKLIMKRKNQPGGDSVDPRAFLILDDCLYDSSWTKHKDVRSIFMNGRHLKMFFILSMQYPLGIPPNLRTNIDYIFILRENIVANRKRLYDNYAGMFPTFEIFCQVMNQCTENYECIVIDNTTTSNKLEECVFWYKASSHATFKICDQHYWDISRNISASDDDEDQYDPDAFKKKNSPNIRVEKNRRMY